MKEFLKFCLVFFLSFMVDGFLTLAINYTTEKKASLAGFWTGAGYLVSSLSILEYVSDPKLIVAVVLGASLGCFFVVKLL